MIKLSSCKRKSEGLFHEVCPHLEVKDLGPSRGATINELRDLQPAQVRISGAGPRVGNMGDADCLACYTGFH